MSFRPYDLLNLVRDFGEELTLRKVTTDGTYNPATGTLSGKVTTDYTFTGYFYNYLSGISPTVDDVRRGVRKCVIPALGLGVEPDSDDLLLGNNDTVRIISVVSVFSDGSPVCFICDVRE